MTVRPIVPVSGSKLHRVWRCPASAVLPQVSSDHAEARAEPARGRGHAVHRYLERVHAIGVVEALAEVPAEHRLLCQALDVSAMPAHLSTEVAYAYNWRDGTARELGRNLGHRNYHELPEPPTEDEIPGTYDVVGAGEVTIGGRTRPRGFLADYKGGHTEYPRPGRFGQTLLGALCLRATMGVEDSTLELIRIHDDGDHHSVRDTVDEWTLDIFADEVRDAMLQLPALRAEVDAGRGIPVHEGHHCDYCPAFKFCDAKIALVRAVPGELVKLGVKLAPTGELDIAPGTLTVRSAAAAYEAAERIEAICRRIRDEVCSMGYHGTITLSDGRTIEPRRTSRRVVAGPIAAALLKERYGEVEAMKAVDLKVSLDAIHETVVRNIDSKLKPRPKIQTRNGDGVFDLLLKELERRQGLATNVSISCAPRQPRKKKALPAGSG